MRGQPQFIFNNSACSLSSRHIFHFYLHVAKRSADITTHIVAMLLGGRSVGRSVHQTSVSHSVGQSVHRVGRSVHRSSVGHLVGQSVHRVVRSVHRSFGWSVGHSVGRSVHRSFGWSVGPSVVRRSFGWSVGPSAIGWLFGGSVGSSVILLVGRSIGRRLVHQSSVGLSVSRLSVGPSVVGQSFGWSIGPSVVGQSVGRSKCSTY